MLASTVQFSTNNQPTTPQPPPDQQPADTRRHTTAVWKPDHAWHTETTTPCEAPAPQAPTPATRAGAGSRVVPSGPNRVLSRRHRPHQPAVPHPHRTPPPGGHPHQGATPTRGPPPPGGPPPGPRAGPY